MILYAKPQEIEDSLVLLDIVRSMPEVLPRKHGPDNDWQRVHIKSAPFSFGLN